MQAPDEQRQNESSSFDMPEDRWLELFRDLALGHERAFECLWEIASGRLYGFALWSTGSREDAADIVSEVFVRVAEQGPKLGQVRRPRAWLLTVARRLITDQLRKRSRRFAEPLESTGLLIAEGHDPDRALDARRASALLACLPRGQRQVVFLRHYADLSYSSIGRVLGIPGFTAASRYRLAIRRLRRLMEKAL